MQLSERIGYLSRAILALNSSNKFSYKEEESELKDKLDVAMIQQKIFNTLVKIEPKNDKIFNAIKQLDSQLFDITKV